MMEHEKKMIWTIGHSTRSLNEFVTMLHSFHIQQVVDVRTYPGSRKFPHFNKEELKTSLLQHGIFYVHINALGGRKKAKLDSKNTAWRNAAFRGYADYMETGTFKEGIDELVDIAEKRQTAYMCSEAVWWRCHRSLISDYLKIQGWQVQHIMALGKSVEHPYTKPAKIKSGQLHYNEEE